MNTQKIKEITLSASLIAIFCIFVVLNRRSETQITPTDSVSQPSQTTLPTKTNESTPPLISAPDFQSGQTAPPTTAPTAAQQPPPATGIYKDGTYTGLSADAYYGAIQVKTVIQGGRIVDVIFLDYPQDRDTSIAVNSQAMPLLKQEAISLQNAQVDIVSGATHSSLAFRQSLSSALAQAK